MATSFYGSNTNTAELKDYADQAAASAANAEAFAVDAEAEADRAQTEANRSQQAATSATNSAAAASASETAALAAQTDAEAAQAAAETAETNAETAEANALASSNNAQAHAADANQARAESEAAQLASEVAAEESEHWAYLSAYYYDLILHMYGEIDVWHDEVEGWHSEVEIWHQETLDARDETIEALEFVQGWYLGAYGTEPTAQPNGDPLITGSLYYDLNTGVMMVWDGTQWVPQIELSTGSNFSYYYQVAVATTTITGADFYGNTLGYQLGYVAVFLNGVKLIEHEDFVANDTASITFVAPLVAGAEVEVIVTNPLTLPANTNTMLDDLQPQFDGVTTTFTLTTSGTPVTPGAANLLMISMRGVWQQPIADYTVSGTNITFTAAPTDDSNFFGLVGVPIGAASTAGIITYSATPPVAPMFESAWFNGSILRIWDGAAWIQVDGGAW